MGITLSRHCEVKSDFSIMISDGYKPAKPRLTWNDWFFIIPLLLYIVVLVFEGALRYYLSIKNLAYLVYLPKALFLLLILLSTIIDLARWRLKKTYLILLYAVGFSFFIGWYNTKNFLQPAFGVWVYIPIIYGALVLPIFLKVEKRGMHFVLMMWIASLVGVFLDFLLPLAWTGFSYDLGQTLIEASRSWATFGIERCAGFSRASYSVAYLLLFLAIYLGSSIKGKLIILIIWIASGLGILATTHKTAIGIYFIITLLYLSLFLFPRTKIVQKAKNIIPVSISIVGICLPLLSSFVTLNLYSYNEEVLFSSFGMRLTDTWPDAISLTVDHGSLFLGRGVGGIGSPQLYFETDLFNPADNMYLSLYVSFGILMFIFITIWIKGLKRLDLYTLWQDRSFWMFSIVILIAGWTVNVIEDPLTSLIIGLSFTYVVQHSARCAFTQSVFKIRQRYHE